MIFYKRLPAIKALSFDLDDTLYDNIDAIKKAEIDFCVYLKDEFNLPQFASNFSFWLEQKEKLLHKNPHIKHDVTEIRCQNLIETFKLLKAQDLSYSKALSLVKIFVKMRSKNIVIDEKIYSLLDTLKSKYKIAAISNGNVDIKVLNLDKFFDYDLRPKVNAYKSKPCSDLFNLYAKTLGINPRNILHVGDDPTTDVYGAIKANFSCAYVERGFAKRCVGFKSLSYLPHVSLDSIYELKELLCVR